MLRLHLTHVETGSQELCGTFRMDTRSGQQECEKLHVPYMRWVK